MPGQERKSSEQGAQDKLHSDANQPALTNDDPQSDSPKFLAGREVLIVEKKRNRRVSFSEPLEPSAIQNNRVSERVGNVNQLRDAVSETQEHSASPTPARSAMRQTGTITQADKDNALRIAATSLAYADVYLRGLEWTEHPDVYACLGSRLPAVCTNLLEDTSDQGQLSQGIEKDASNRGGELLKKYKTPAVASKQVGIEARQCMAFAWMKLNEIEHTRQHQVHRLGHNLFKDEWNMEIRRIVENQHSDGIRARSRPGR